MAAWRGLDERFLVKPTTEEIGRRYDRAARGYAFWQPLKERTGIAMMRRRLLSRARGEVLEVASGAGASFRHYPRDVLHSVSITAVDISPRMLELAQDEAARLGLAATARVMDAEHLAYRDDSFDTVVCAFSLCTFSDPVAALGEMSRVCRVGGRVLLLGHGLSNRRAIAALQNLRALRCGAKRGCRGNQDPISLTRSAGLEIVAVRRSWSGIFYELESRLRRG